MILSFGVRAQLAHGGTPMYWGSVSEERSNTPTLALEALGEVEKQASMDTNTGPKGYQFGTQRIMDADILAAGQWDELENGYRVCRYTLRSPGALMMSVQFSAFHPAWGAQLFVYDEARTQFLGAFTVQNQRPDGLFATAFLPGDAITIEYQEPVGAASGQVQVSNITHAWQSIFPSRADDQRDFNPGYQSSACQINVICPVAADWQDPNRSVIWYVMPSGIRCNGTLLNNTLQDGTPYVLIANHCYQPTEAQWVFYFNYQSPTCVGDTGQTAQTITGSVLRSASYYKDFCLLEMSDAPPPSFDPYYAGWDRGGAAPQSGVCISNPLGDVKKIAFYSAPATTAISPGIGVECWQVYWSNGLLESGSSGAPLFDQNKRLVGHIADGEQTCATASTVPTLASKFSVNWDGAAPSARLRDWLDPANTTMALNGYSPNVAPSTLALRVKVMLEGPYVQAQGLMTSALNDAGILPLTEPYTSMGYAHHGGGGGENTTQAVLNINGSTRIVDWVVLELRDKNDPANVLATRSALLRRNGTIVDVNGTSDVGFQGRATDQYYVAVRHRNHLGIMTASTQALSPTGSLINLTNASVSVCGGTDATTSISGVRCLWSGDVNMDGEVKYTGQNNDRDPILTRIGSVMATAQYYGYAVEDVNMNGSVKYTGAGNDRDAILLNLSGAQNGVRIGHLP
ncbi:MAG: trypsin-like peptidase domain-containing protein [Flavobacteriales bacterium]